jgi:O-antigen biosynthesis protein
MLAYLHRDGVGAVGAKLLYPDRRIQHAGVILGIGGVAGHSHKYAAEHDYGYFGRLVLPQALSAVTGACLMVRREAFDAVGGLEEGKLGVAFNDVDFCLRLRERGWRCVWTPYARLIHHESLSRGYEDTPEKQARFAREVQHMMERWHGVLARDPHYNPNLTLRHEDFSLSDRPRPFADLVE